MSSRLNEEDLQMLHQLVSKLTGFEEDSDIFQYTFKHVVTELLHADSLAFVTQTEMNRTISGLSDKFVFHGFLKHAGDLTQLYEKFLGKGTPKDELRNRLNVMKMLTCLSENPTGSLANLPEDFATIRVQEEEDIDWKSYLWEGVERWSPPLDSDSDKWTDEESDTLYVSALEDVVPEISLTNEFVSSKTTISSTDDDFNYRMCLSKVNNSIQHGWFNSDHVRMLPISTHPEANVAIRWEKHLENMTYGLLKSNKLKIISEYKVVREVIWQLWQCHNGVAFKFSGNKLVPQDNLTISSCRPAAFQDFLKVFLPYIEMLEEFRTFEAEILGTNPADFSSQTPNTYKSYSWSVRNIIHPTKKSLVDLEIETLKQDETMTLLKLANICKNLFKTVKLLKEIHTQATAGYKNCNRLECATNLLYKLHEGLKYPETKVMQDIYLCLYLESLYTYMGIIDNWLSKGDFADYCQEFPIIDCRSIKQDWSYSSIINSADISKSIENGEEWLLEFKLHPLDINTSNDGLFSVITKKVLQIGKNIHLLRMLGKLHLINDSNSQTETLYEEFIREVLLDISLRFGNCAAGEAAAKDEGIDVKLYKFPAICSDFCKFPTEMDKLENVVDTDYPFLMKAFEGFFVDDTERDCETVEEPLFSRISKLTTYIFPAHYLIEKVFSKILHGRYGGCGRTVKNLLKHDYQLDDHLELLRHVFLFKDGVIFDFYRKLFVKIETSKKWDDDMSLTSHLQDIMVDLHPILCDKLTVIVMDSWTKFIWDPLKSTTIFRINFKIGRPLSIIIKPSHMRLYNELFFFIFQIKWALYMLGRLQFKDIEIKNDGNHKNRTVKIIQMRLKILRFGLVNIFTLIQHYVLGYIFGKCLVEFEENYNNAHDLDTLINSHDKFITDLHKNSACIRDFNENTYGFYMLLYLVRKLYLIWKNLKNFDIKELDKHERLYKECHKRLMPILCPYEYVEC